MVPIEIDSKRKQLRKGFVKIANNSVRICQSKNN